MTITVVASASSDMDCWLVYAGSVSISFFLKHVMSKDLGLLTKGLGLCRYSYNEYNICVCVIQISFAFANQDATPMCFHLLPLRCVELYFV